MNKVLPHSTAPTRMYGAKPLALIDHNASQNTGPTVSYRNPSAVSSGVLAGWDADAAHAFVAMPRSVETWDAMWSENDAYFIDHVRDCNTPEEVEELIPSKWIAYKLATDGDEVLGRVCKLCTALVDRFIELSQGTACDRSTAKWRLHQTMLHRLRAVMELLEASIGESIPILKLKDVGFVSQCWQRIGDEDKQQVVAALSSTDGR